MSDRIFDDQPTALRTVALSDADNAPRCWFSEKADQDEDDEEDDDEDDEDDEDEDDEDEAED
jgi:hypothetical protein